MQHSASAVDRRLNFENCDAILFAHFLHGEGGQRRVEDPADKARLISLLDTSVRGMAARTPSPSDTH